MIQLRETTAWPTLSWAELAAALPQSPEIHLRLAPLSPAERLVAVHLAQGLSNREIATALGKSEATVKHQVSACLHKLGASTRARLIAALARM